MFTPLHSPVKILKCILNYSLQFNFLRICEDHNFRRSREGGMEERRGAVSCYRQETASHHRQIKYLQEMSGGCCHE